MGIGYTGPCVLCCGFSLRLQRPVVACPECGKVYLASGVALSVTLPDLQKALFTSLDEGYRKVTRELVPLDAGE